MNKLVAPIIYTPDDEPYLGEYSLHVFDTLLVATLENSNRAIAKAQEIQLNDLQKAASVIIPQATSISFSIRELIRQGYLFGASVLLRSMIERTAILEYLYYYPEDIKKWNEGWNRNCPGLADMFNKIQLKNEGKVKVEGKELTASLNSLVHGKPDSIDYCIIDIKEDNIGLTSAKSINRPDLCNYLCDQLISWLSIVNAMIYSYFELKKTNLTTAST